jgi:outer membrane protein TolC
MKIATSFLVATALWATGLRGASLQGPDRNAVDQNAMDQNVVKQPQQLSLAHALEIADKASPEIQAARLRALELQVQSKSARAGLLPQVSASIAGTYQTSNLEGIGFSQPGIPTRVGPYRLFDARPSVSMKVLDLSLLASVRAAQARTKQSEAEAAAIAERTHAAIIDLYLQALEADSRKRATEARITTAEAVLRQTSDAEQAGRSSKLDVARATQQLEKERAGLIDVTQ